jgi:hypothetical protein
MKVGIFLPAALLGIWICLSGSPAFPGDLKPIRLMPMQLDTGRPLMHVLRERKSARAFNPKKLPNRVLSNLLWAANGINRPGSGGRTAPSAMNQQDGAAGLCRGGARQSDLCGGLRENGKDKRVGQGFLRRRRCGFYQPECLPLLRIRRPCHRRQGQHRPEQPRRRHEAPARSENHPCPIRRVSAKMIGRALW